MNDRESVDRFHVFLCSCPDEFLKSRVNVFELIEFYAFYSVYWHEFCGVTINKQLFNKRGKWYWKKLFKRGWDNYKKCYG